mmetsp:Transcript_49190/g.96159  ORF Transcript_49190/g.96159 Transcript_49190/m.96159 type:complete len:600 (+) Transcript_49190:246-2045(+)
MGGRGARRRDLLSDGEERVSRWRQHDPAVVGLRGHAGHRRGRGDLRRLRARMAGRVGRPRRQVEEHRTARRLRSRVCDEQHGPPDHRRSQRPPPPLPPLPTETVFQRRPPGISGDRRVRRPRGDDGTPAATVRRQYVPLVVAVLRGRRHRRARVHGRHPQESSLRPHRGEGPPHHPPFPAASHPLRGPAVRVRHPPGVGVPAPDGPPRPPVPASLEGRLPEGADGGRGLGEAVGGGGRRTHGGDRQEVRGGAAGGHLWPLRGAEHHQRRRTRRVHGGGPAAGRDAPGSRTPHPGGVQHRGPPALEQLRVGTRRLPRGIRGRRGDGGGHPGGGRGDDEQLPSGAGQRGVGDARLSRGSGRPAGSGRGGVHRLPGGVPERGGAGRRGRNLFGLRGGLVRIPGHRRVRHTPRRALPCGRRPPGLHAGAGGRRRHHPTHQRQHDSRPALRPRRRPRQRPADLRGPLPPTIHGRRPGCRRRRWDRGVHHHASFRRLAGGARRLPRPPVRQREHGAPGRPGRVRTAAPAGRRGRHLRPDVAHAGGAGRAAEEDRPGGGGVVAGRPTAAHQLPVLPPGLLRVLSAHERRRGDQPPQRRGRRGGSQC